jgi:hypothetical protein
MATITMTLSGVLHYVSASDLVGTKASIQLATNKKTSEMFIPLQENKKGSSKFLLALTDFSLHKKMYQPTEIIAQITITSASGQDKDYQPVSRKVLEKMFKLAKVAVSEGNFNVGDNFYVFEVLPQYFEASMVVTLKIYSLDKLMTLQETSRTFVGKRLGADILKTEAINYVEPDDMMKKSQAWINANEELTKEKNTIDGKKESLEKKKNGDDAKAYEEAVKEELDDKKKIADLEQDLKNTTKYTGTTIKVNIDNMKTLVYVDQNTNSSTNGLKCEHIHHYLVQYNESFYDMLARTCNRWGEFLYYENGELNLGYDNTKAPIDLASTGFKSISFFDLNSKEVSVSQKGKYELEADNSSLRGFSLEESPFIPKGQFGYMDERHKVDKWIMKQFPAIFKNDKNLPTMLTNIMFDNLFSLAMAKSSTAKLNSDADEKYFAKYDDNTKDQHYGSFDFANAKKAEPKRLKKAYQEFSELYTNYNEKGYNIILQKELSVGKDAIHIDYQTTFPKLKLGDIITYNSENFIVVEIKSSLDSKKGPVFEVVATAQDSKDKLFYPAVIPSGHVRYAHPQEATITDASDPTGFNRVRVLFNWQKEYIKYKDELNKPKGCDEETIKMSTPWLTFASNQQGAPVTGYHYVGYPVMVGFVDGNVERPYVMGGISDDFVIADSVMQTEGGQRLQISDGFGNGMTAFLSGVFSPLLKTFTGFMPGLIPSWDWKKSRRFEGGFELTDYYGIYKVSGSTDGRNVTVASPWGDVKINAFTGINISAPNGDVKISGKNVTIEAGNNLKLVSGTNVNYKLWKSKDTWKGTLAQIALDMSAQVAKKIAEIAMSAIDLSLVRSTVEIFFRPVEGSLTVKSNRYLKLESGNSSCQYPEAAYNVKKKRKLLDEINKETIIETAKLGPGMVEIFNMIKPVTNVIIDNYVMNYNQCVSDLQKFKRSFLALELVSTGLDKKPCKTFEDLRDDLLGQDANKKWDADKLAFSDTVKIDGKPTKILTATEADKIAAIIGAQGSYKVVAKQIIAKRKQAREDILMDLNKLRKSIYHLTHPVDKIYINSYFSKHHDNDMPKDYKKKVITAFSKQKCPNAYIYILSDEDKKFATTKLQPQSLGNDKKYMARLVALNLLEEFGFTDATRKKVVLKPIPAPPIPPAPAALPLKPKTDTMDASDPLNIMNSSQWENYVSSLSGVPAIGKDKTTIGETLKAATWGTIKDKAKNNIAALYYAKKEHDTWGEGKNGQILFASGKGTVALKNNQLEAVTGIAPSYKTLNSGSEELDKPEQKSLEKFVDQIRRCLKNL